MTCMLLWRLNNLCELQGFCYQACILLGLYEMSSRDTFAKCFCFTFRSLTCGTASNFIDSASHLRKGVYAQNPKHIT